MWPVPTKSQVGVGFTLDVEREGIVEDVLVVVGRAVEQTHSLTRFDPRTPDFGIPAGRTLENMDGAWPPGDLSRGCCRTGPLVELPLLGMVEHRDHARRRRISGRLVAGNQQQ